MSNWARVELEGNTAGVAGKAAEVLEREISERCGTNGRANGGAVRILLAICPGAGTEGFTIRNGANGSIVIEGHDERGLVYGIGKFLRGCRMRPGEFVPSPWRGSSRPEKPVRAMYFATHFHNFYHDAPVEKVRRYVEELALWGCNALSVWFDMHHYNGIEDPEAQKMIERLRAVLDAGRSVGMGGALTTLANEGYANSPEDLRADWTAGHDGYHTPPGGHYHVELCPARPGAIELELKWRREILDAFSGIPLEYVWLWPYDQGGCTCSRCAPWGVNGFLRISKPVARMIRRIRPEAKIVLSTWYFDRFTGGEWEGLAAKFRNGAPDWVDYLMADDFSKGIPQYVIARGVPGNLPLLNFPEISMENMWPWGGFGANPRPDHWQKYWDRAGDLVSGGFPYSEGIFEDINKVIHLQFGWSPRRRADDIVKEYAEAYFDREAAADIQRAVFRLEREMPVSVGVDSRQTGRDAVRYSVGSRGQAADTAAILADVERRLAPGVRRSWRWRILKIRADIAAEAERSSGRPTDSTEAWLEELCGIYHADMAEFAVACPSVKTLARLHGWEGGNRPENTQCF